MSEDTQTANTSEEVQAKVIEEFGFDPETQGETIEKITNERIENQKNLSKTIEQKAKYREQGVKAGILDPVTFEPIEKKPEGGPLKTNTEQSEPTMEHMALFGQGFTLDEVKVIEEGAKVLGVSVTDASQNDFVKSKVEAIRNENKVKANSMGASTGSPGAARAKTPGNMTDDEHRAFAEDKLKGAVNA